MYIYYNPNPRGHNVGDCTVRAISKVLEQTWEETYAGISSMGYYLCDMPSANHVWGAYLRKNGYERVIVDDHGRDDYTVNDFCKEHPKGKYVLAISGHVVCVINGDYYDSWDSGNEIPLYKWRLESGTSSNMDKGGSR